MIEPVDRTTEATLIENIDRSGLERHLDALAGLERVSGSKDERIAAEYVVETLEEYGVETTCEEFEGYVSVPERGELEVTHPTTREFDALTVAFSASTPPEGVHAELVVLGEDALREERVRIDPTGRVVLVDSLPNPTLACAADELGAAGVVFMSPNEHLYEGSVSPVWGTPTPETARDLPDIPVVEVTRGAGAWLREEATGGTVELTVRSRVTTELRTLPCPVGRIDGTESDRFFLIGNHIDSWHEGVTDNATAVAVTLELARLFADRTPKRGLVFGFWPAHSTGRYAGSAWYADTNWLDLRENGVAYLHIDLPGLRNAEEIWYQHMAELADEHLDIIRNVVELDIQDGAESYLGSVGRPARNSDQSFWGTGLSSLLSGARLTPGTEEGGPIGGGWWWHTPEDTRDKVDVDVLTEETKLYVALASRICESPIPPHDFTATVDDFHDVLDEIEDSNEIGSTLAPVREDLDALRRMLMNAYGFVEERLSVDEQSEQTPSAENTSTESLATEFEDLQVRLGNVLIPGLYMEREEYDHDPKGPYQRLPGLRSDHGEGVTDRERRFATVRQQREMNEIRHRVRRATAETETFLKRVQTD